MSGSENWKRSTSKKRRARKLRSPLEEDKMALSMIVLAALAVAGCGIMIAAIVAVVWVIAQERKR